jgi:hypothetical protein
MHRRTIAIAIAAATLTACATNNRVRYVSELERLRMIIEWPLPVCAEDWDGNCAEHIRRQIETRDQALKDLESLRMRGLVECRGAPEALSCWETK